MMSVNLKIELSEYTNGNKEEKEILDGIDFSDWHFYPSEDKNLMLALQDAVRKEMAESIRNTLQSDPPTIEFHNDGTKLWVTINVGADRNDGNVWFVASINEMIADFIERTHRGWMDGGDEAKADLAKCLRACASNLDRAIKEE
jgi:hypothetical protein